MKHLFVPYELSVIAKEKGFNDQCLASYSGLSYPINDSGNDYKETLCLYMPFDNAFDEIKMLWVESEDANFHWNEGTYYQGSHSRCDLSGQDFDTPTYQQLVDWFRDNTGLHISIKANTNGINFSSFDYTIFGLEGFIKTGFEKTHCEALNASIREAFKLI